MSVYIAIGDKWVVTSDQYQFILNEKKIAKSGKGAGKEWLSTIGYYPKVSQLVTGLIHHSMQSSAVESFADMAAEVDRIGKACEKAFTSHAA